MGKVTKYFLLDNRDKEARRVNRDKYMTSSIDSAPWSLTQIFPAFLSDTSHPAPLKKNGAEVVRTQLWGTMETKRNLTFSGG